MLRGAAPGLRLGDGPLPAQRLGADDLPPAPARQGPAQDLQRRPARVRPRKLGYVIDPKAIPPQQIPLLFEINTTASGNLNIGHEGPEYGTDLKDDQRYDLLEYLKTL